MNYRVVPWPDDAGLRIEGESNEGKEREAEKIHGWYGSYKQIFNKWRWKRLSQMLNSRLYVLRCHATLHDETCELEETCTREY